jgi:adenosyl cobinamide kinase/adenosyl cobinamide phosphate guanylyltransferase
VITLVLGGARSGKSTAAERLACGLPAPVTYVATAEVTDDDMAERIAGHRARRPPGWTTVEAGPELADVLQRVRGTALVDSLGAWVARTTRFAVDVDGLCAALCARAGDTVLVSDEVGLGVHPATEAGRRFRDVLGLVNQGVAARADDVWLVVAGRLLRLERA